MMRIEYIFDNDERVTGIKLNAGTLTGLEHPSSLKDAVESLKITNPCTEFSRRYKRRLLSMNYTENEIGEMAEVSNFLADLWQYEYSPDASGSDMQMYMNPLHILQNALNLIIEQRKIICEYKEKTGN